jgi:hypothetical protein
MGLKWIVVVIALVAGGWMLFDGLHAFATGDYVTPASGARAGELGPWAALVEALGIEPRSTLMKTVFVAYGAAWLIVAAAFALGERWTLGPMRALAFGALWYLVIGTVLSVLLLVLLALPSLRRAYGAAA